ncbi:hypothetical protein [Vibrio sp. 10N.247.311.26]|uniref:hypothetical protein n=1 Tax=Vibrio sp. 10N.247.311.26 TaxID=3229995 RepID=UPI00354B6415
MKKSTTVGMNEVITPAIVNKMVPSRILLRTGVKSASVPSIAKQGSFANENEATDPTLKRLCCVIQWN